MNDEGARPAPGSPGYRDDLAAAKERLARLEDARLERDTSADGRVRRDLEHRRQVLMLSRRRGWNGDAATGVLGFAGLIAVVCWTAAASGRVTEPGRLLMIGLLIVSGAVALLAALWLLIKAAARGRTRSQLEAVEASLAALKVPRVRVEAPDDLGTVHTRIAALEDELAGETSGRERLGRAER